MFLELFSSIIIYNTFKIQKKNSSGFKVCLHNSQINVLSCSHHHQHNTSSPNLPQRMDQYQGWIALLATQGLSWTCCNSVGGLSPDGGACCNISWRLGARRWCVLQHQLAAWRPTVVRVASLSWRLVARRWCVLQHQLAAWRPTVVLNE